MTAQAWRLQQRVFFSWRLETVIAQRDRSRGLAAQAVGGQNSTLGMITHMLLVKERVRRKTAFGGWADAARRSRRSASQAGRVITRMLQGVLLAAFNSWFDALADRRRRQGLIAKVAFRLAKATENAVMNQWVRSTVCPQLFALNCLPSTNTGRR